MVKIFWLLFWANIGLLLTVIGAMIGLIWFVFFSKRELSDEEKKEILKLIKGGKHDN